MTWLSTLHSWKSLRLKPLALPFALALLSSLALGYRGSKTEPVSRDVDTEQAGSIDSMVPEGYVLVPIEVINMEALDSIVGSFGLVDLYAPGEEGPSLRKIGSRMKMVRSVAQPSFISLLVPEEEALRLLAEPGPFKVTVLNPVETKGTVSVHRKRVSRIHYQDK